MQTFPECAATEEPMGAQFDPPGFATEIRRFAESKEGAFSRFSREAGKFHEKMAKKYGVNTEAGRVHYKASRAYREAATRLQEFFENGGEVNELDPNAIIRANKDAVAFHKKAAEKAGLDSDQGHAHVAALEHHLDIINKAKKGKEAKFGHKGKEVPLPVPKKSEQPSGDIRQKKPLMKLQSPEAKKKENGYLAPRYEKSHQSKREARIDAFPRRSLRRS